MIQLIKKYAVFGVAFGIAKATVYFIPLLLADVLTEYDYGVLEYALAGLGMVVNTIINLGASGSFPYFVLKKKDLNIIDGFRLHPIWLLIPFALNQVLFFANAYNIDLYLAFNVSFIIANQVFYSTQLKSYESIIKSVFLDSGIYLVLLVLYVLGLAELVSINIETINLIVLIYALGYVLYGSYMFLKADKAGILKKYIKILKFGVHLLFSSFFIYLITVSGRIIVEYIFDYESVGLYAFYFRLSAIVVMIHQVVNIVFFKKMYTFDPRTLDKYYSVFFVGIFVLSLIVFFVSPYIVNHFSEFFRTTYLVNKGLYFLLSCQMVMWIASALNANIIVRENLVSKNNPRFFALIILGVLIIYFLKDRFSLALLTYVHFSIIFLATIIQYFSLSKKRIFFKKSAIALTLAYIVSSCTYFICF